MGDGRGIEEGMCRLEDGEGEDRAGGERGGGKW